MIVYSRKLKSIFWKKKQRKNVCCCTYDKWSSLTKNWSWYCIYALEECWRICYSIIKYKNSYNEYSQSHWMPAADTDKNCMLILIFARWLLFLRRLLCHCVCHSYNFANHLRLKILCYMYCKWWAKLYDLKWLNVW